MAAEVSYHQVLPDSHTELQLGPRKSPALIILHCFPIQVAAILRCLEVHFTAQLPFPIQLQYILRIQNGIANRLTSGPALGTKEIL